MWYVNTKGYDDGDIKGLFWSSLQWDSNGHLRSGRGREEEVKGILGEQIRSYFFVERLLWQRALWESASAAQWLLDQLFFNK